MAAVTEDSDGTGLERRDGGRRGCRPGTGVARRSEVEDAAAVAEDRVAALALGAQSLPWAADDAIEEGRDARPGVRAESRVVVAVARELVVRALGVRTKKRPPPR